MIEQLDTPAPVSNVSVPAAIATHRAWGFTHQPWNEPPVASYSVLGVVVDGRFVALPGTEYYAGLSGEDYAGCLDGSGALTSTAVREQHVMVKEREAAAAAARDAALAAVAESAEP